MKLTRGDFIVVGILGLLLGGFLFLSNYHNGEQCVNCNAWYKSTGDMIEIVPADALARVINVKLRLCNLCAHDTERLNVRNIMRHERSKGVEERQIIFHALLVQQLIDKSNFVRIQKDTSQSGGD